MNMGHRLKKVRFERGLKQTELAEKANTTQQSIQKIESGLSKGGRIIEQIADALSIHPSWLQFGESFTPEANTPTPALRFIPLVEWSQIRSRTAEYHNPLFPIPKNNGSDQSYILTVKNDAMESQKPGYKSFLMGEKIAVDPMVKANSSHYVIAALDQHPESEPVFRQLIQDGPKRFLKPLNNQYPIIEMNYAMSVIGVVFLHFDDRLML